MSIKYNRDFDDFHEDIEYNLRYDFLSKLVYNCKSKICFSFYTKCLANHIPGAFTIISPRNGIY